MRFNALIPELAVVSIAESRRFYCDVLGFSIAYERSEEGFAFLELGEVQLMLDQIGSGRTFDRDGPLRRPLGRGLNLQICVESVESLLGRLQRSGWPLYLPLEDRWYRTGEAEVGNRQVVVADPDGYLLRFAQDLGSRQAATSDLTRPGPPPASP
jgi:catechol 2,3-dioxygenase-like lactoylglutathione lyase family enzyme